MLNIRRDSGHDRYTLIIQLIRERRKGVVFTSYKLLPEEFDKTRGVAVATSRSKAHRAFIAEVNDYLTRQIEELRRIIVELERRGRPFGTGDIVRAYRQRCDNRYVSTFFLAQIDRLEQEGKMGTARTYRTALTAFEKYAGARRLHFAQVDQAMLSDFEHYLKTIPLQQNTVVFYMSKFRAVYNKARSKGLAGSTPSPFESFPLRTEKTRKLAVGPKVVRQVIQADLESDSRLIAARDLFLFSFYTRGMSFVDMAYLRREDIRDGVIYYRRHKTGQLYNVAILPELQQIIDRYEGRCLPWVLPVMMEYTPDGDAVPMVCDDPSPEAQKEFRQRLYKRYKYGLTHYLRYLRRLSRTLGLERSLSFNVARHTWASLARDKGIPVSVISVGLGHTTEKTTAIYLDELNNHKLDEANRIVASL